MDGSFHLRELDAAFSGSTFPQEIRDVMHRLHFSREEVRRLLEHLVINPDVV